MSEQPLEEIHSDLRQYFAQWREWLKKAKGFNFSALKPMHVGWKVPSETVLAQKIVELLPVVREGHIGTVDSRKIALLVLDERVEQVPVLQIMQLRPGSKDALGLDHVAFYCRDMAALQAALKNRPEKWEVQSNSPDHHWISMWFGPNNREAKFFDHTSLDLAIGELNQVSAEIK